MRRWWLVGGLVAVLVLAGLGVGVAWRPDDRPCGAAVASYGAAASTSPFDGPAEPADPRLVRALGRYGEVLGGYGYDYVPPQVTSYAAGLGVRLRDDNRFTLLDDATLAPRWSVAVGTPSSTFDRSASQYVVVTLPGDAAPEVVALDLSSGERRWCAALDADPVADEPVSTRVLDDGSVLVLVGGDGSRASRALRVGDDGVAWEASPAAGSGDRLETTPDGALAVVGGSPLTDLLDPAALATNDDEVALAGLSVADGTTRWSVPGAPGSDLALAGVADDGTVVATEAVDGEAQPSLVGLSSADGSEVWRTTPARGTAFDTTVRGDRVLVRAGTTWTAYDAADGAELWSFSVPATPQYLPYGTVLDSLPSLDPDTLLVGGTAALVTLDLRDGSRRAVPLPTDGVATTYWPTSLAASPGLLAVVTNTATVVVRR